jgi:outer membrane protein TolC
VRAVLERNPTLESARQGWRAALARGHQAGAFEDPMLDIGVAPLSVGSSEARFGYEVSVSQKLPWFGKRDLEAEANLAEGDAAKSDYESLKRELAVTAVTLYEQAFVASKSLEINAEHVQLMRAMREAANAQFASGRGSAQDALQAETELTHLEHDSVILASQRTVTLAQMNELLHRAPELSLPPLPVELGAPGDPALDPASAERDAAQNRPDIQAAQQRARAEQVRAQRAERESYPDVTLSTSYSSMWDMPQHRWMVGLGLALPIQTGRRGAAADEARAMSAQFEAEVARLQDAARTRAFVALKQLEESRHVLRLFETRLLPVAQQQIDAARAGFITAQNGFTSVIEAERNLRSVALEHQQARAQYVQRRAELDHALGRIAGLDWNEETP